MFTEILDRKNTPYARLVNPILSAALCAVDPYECVYRNIALLNGDQFTISGKLYSLDEYDHIYLIGTGKAVQPMAGAVMDKLSSRISGGILIGKHDDAAFSMNMPQEISFTLGSHPVPSLSSIQSTIQLTAFLRKVTRKDLVICLISGGGSALMTLPYDPLTLEDVQATTKTLLFSGATINEVNVVRKHLDQVKGGGLARMAAPATLITLVLSDVIGDDLDAIASGPTVADHSTYGDAMDIIKKYKLEKSLPQMVIEHLHKGVKGLVPETVKEQDACLAKTCTAIVGSLAQAAEAAQRKASEDGFQTRILTASLKGEAREVGKQLGMQLRQMAAVHLPSSRPMCLIAGGETTVTIKGSGKGGRNQELALSAAREIQGVGNCLFVSLATDGEDGPTDAAGGAVDGSTIQKGNHAGMDAGEFLDRNDAYRYLDAADALIRTGPTGTNVNDLMLMFVFTSRVDQQGCEA